MMLLVPVPMNVFLGKLLKPFIPCSVKQGLVVVRVLVHQEEEGLVGLRVIAVIPSLL